MRRENMNGKFSRREFVKLATVTVTTAGLGLSGSGGLVAAEQERAATKALPPLGADEALRELLAGNERFAKGRPSHSRRMPNDFSALAEGQFPAAVIVGCADSRVAPEILFDVGLGDLFVVRVAGNVVGGAGPVVKGSIEYAVAELNVRLIMVLGHTGCGAVKAAIKHIDAKDALPGAINDLVELIKPAVVKSKAAAGDPLDNAIRANVAIGVERLKGLQPIMAGPVNEGKVKVVGAIYDLRSGKVTMVA
jgi:carbonic anhydrase